MISVNRNVQLSQQRIREVEKIISDILKEYQNKIPIYTTYIEVQPGVVPHSHPYIVLNTKHVESRNPKIVYLSLLIHEQLHWFTQTKKSQIIKLKEKNKHLLDNNLISQHLNFSDIDSFVEHIVVIWNEIDIMKQLVSKQDFNWLYFQYPRKRYRNMNRWIIKNFDKIKKELEKFDLIWRKRK